MKEIGRYDTSLQMFVEEPRPVDSGRLRFMRWLGEQGRLEHAVAGPPQGDLALAMVALHGKDSLTVSKPTRTLREHIAESGGK